MADYLTTDTELTSVANAIRTKGGTSASLVYPTGFVSAIEAISTGTDVSDTTATAGDVLSGKYFYTSSAVKTQGTIATKTGSDLSANGKTVTVPAGYYASQATKDVATGTEGTPTATKGTVSNNSVSVTPSVTNSAGYITGSTKTGTAVTVSASELVSGTKAISASGTTDVTNYESVSVEAGSATTPATTITANPSISVSGSGLITATASATQSVTPTVSAGYVASGTAGTITVSGSNTSQLTTQAAQTIHPSTTDQTIASGKYLTGTQTVKGVLLTNLDAGNIKKDVVVKVGDSTDDDCVTSVTGTYEGGGGITEAEKKDVNFYDYDGTRLYSYTASEFANLSALPANPTHDGLTAQGWNWSLANAKTHVASCTYLDIGQMYVTTDGKTHLHIEISSAKKSVQLYVYGTSSSMSCQVDWGDNSSTSTLSGNGSKNTSHTYSTGGKYTIKINVTAGSIKLGSNSSSNAVLGSTTNQRKYHNASIKHAEIGSNTDLADYAFYYCENLESVTLPQNVAFGSCPFGYCQSLKHLTIPTGVTTLAMYTFQQLTTIKSVSLPYGLLSFANSATSQITTIDRLTIPNTVTSLGSYSIGAWHHVPELVIPASVTQIANNCINSAYSIAAYHFLSTTPPTLGGSSAIYTTSSPIIYVPKSSGQTVLNAYKTADNWTNYATMIQEEPE